MIDWIFENGQNVVAILETFGFVTLGAIALYGMYGTKDNDRRTESDQLADGLLERQRQTIEQMGSDIKTLQSQSKTQQEEIHKLQGQNDAYLKIITLRDPAAAKVFEAAPEIHQIIRDTYRVVEALARSQNNLTDTVERFITNLPPMTPTIRP